MVRRRRPWPGLAGAILVALAVGGCRRGAPVADAPVAPLPAAPGVAVVVLSFDALRADALGIYGYGRPTTPHLDAFAAEAVVFDRAYAAAPVTPTSFAAAFTGCLPHRVFLDWKLRAEGVLAEAFAAAGYRTAAFTSNAQLSPERGFGRGFAHYGHDSKASDEVLLDRAAAWLDAAPDERTFAWIHLLTPHAPYRRHDGAAAFYDPAYEGRFAETSGVRFQANDPEELRRLRDLYDGEVWHADQLFARFLAHLRAAGLLERTVVVVTADHGEEFFEHGGVRHGRLHEEHLRVPLLIRHPKIRTGARVRAPVSNVDVAPTLTAVAGVPWPHRCEGRNLLAERVDDTRPIVGLAMTGPDYRAATVRRADLRLIVTCAPAPADQLYDLGLDPAGVTDVAAARLDQVRDLRSLLFGALTPWGCAELAGAGAPVAETRGLRPDTVDSLRALGYVE